MKSVKPDAAATELVRPEDSPTIYPRPYAQQIAATSDDPKRTKRARQRVQRLSFEIK